ncbi:MAG: multiple antibiotic resistance protein [Candidatus Pelagisphaera sp.]|jgi:multiple antibiotic resistance protein
MTLFEFAPLAFVSLFVVIGPFSAVPLFLAMTPGDTTQDRIHMAKLACITVAGVLLLFAIAGSFLLKIFGISIYAFQAAGGILLFLISLSMLQAKDPPQKISPEDSEAGAARDDIAVTPLAVPLLAGPGAISTSILLANQAESLTNRIVLYATIIVVSLSVFWILNISVRGAKWIDPLYLRVGTRLMGLLLAALAMQFVFNGIQSSGILIQ